MANLPDVDTKQSIANLLAVLCPGAAPALRSTKIHQFLVMSITALHKTCLETVSFPPYLAASCSAASSSLQCRCWDVKEHEQNGFHHVSPSKVASFPSSEDDTCSEEEVSESGDSEPGEELFTLAPEKIEKSGIHDACLSRCRSCSSSCSMAGTGQQQELRVKLVIQSSLWN